MLHARAAYVRKCVRTRQAHQNAELLGGRVLERQLVSHKHSHIRELEGPGIGRVGGRQKGGRMDIVTIIVFAQYRCMSTAVGFGGFFSVL